MKLNSLNNSTSLPQDSKAFKKREQLKRLLEALGERDLPEETLIKVNTEIDNINTLPDTSNEKEQLKVIRKAYNKIVQTVVKDVKLVPKNYYRNMWLALGMSAFGVPFGTILGLGLDNMAYISIGLPFGMAIGVAIGAQMDKKAEKDGLQLNVEG